MNETNHNVRVEIGNTEIISMDSVQLIPVYVFIFLFFIVFKAANFEFVSVLPIISTHIKNTVDNTREMKLSRFQRKNYNINSDAASNYEKNDIRTQVKRAKRYGKEPKIWDHWGNWSTCSVTCGIGKIMRWRHCIAGNCSLGEKKAQLKTCTSAAC